MKHAIHPTDEFGFAEAVQRISTINLTDTANRVFEACHRGTALLRTLHYRLVNDSRHEMSFDEIETLVETALTLLPDPHGEAFDRMDQFSVDVNNSVRGLLGQQQALTALLGAMTVAARPDASLADLNAAADTIYTQASRLPNGAQHWQAFCELVQGWGLSVVWVDLGHGLPPSPEIHTTESLKKARRLWRKTDKLARQLRELGQSNGKPLQP